MNIISVDDESLALKEILEITNEIFADKDSIVKGFRKCSEAISYVNELATEKKTLDYAFLDIKMRGMRGIELAKIIKDVFPNVKILFVTGYDEYACEAFQLHALGYILKPATVESVLEVLNVMDVDWQTLHQENDVRVQTFGHFEVFVNGEVMSFERSKCKELLAYLVDRKGAGITTSEVCTVLWEDKPYDRSVKSQAQKVISIMMKNLKEAGIEDIIVKKWNYLAVNPEAFACDYYDYVKGDAFAVNTYMGEYMTNYSWAEFTLAELEQKRNS